MPPPLLEKGKTTMGKFFCRAHRTYVEERRSDKGQVFSPMNSQPPPEMAKGWHSGQTSLRQGHCIAMNAASREGEVRDACPPTTSTLKRRRQEDQEFQYSLGYKRLSQKRNKMLPSLKD